MRAVEQRITSAAERARRKRSDITLVAVSKKFSSCRIREAYGVGLRDFGENYVQEFSAKSKELMDLTGARFHLIGHLQSNKARVACELFQVVQTVDSPKLLERLNTHAAERAIILEIFLEVKLSGEQSKTGAAPEDIPALLDAARDCPSVHVSGLMTMPPWSEDPELSRPYFKALARLAEQNGLRELSMGMSNDLEVAIEEGATTVRVGTALFGKRPKPEEAHSFDQAI